MSEGMTLLRAFAPVIAGLALAFLAYFAMQHLNIDVSGLRGATARRMARLAGGEPEPSLADRLGDRLLERLGLDPRVWSLRLEWAQLGGHFANWTVGGVVGRGLLYAALAAVYASLVGGVVFWLMALLVFVYPFLRVRAKARQVQALTRRALPETATLVAAEMAAGNAPDQALGRAAELPGVLGRLLNRAVLGSRASGRPLFSRSQQVRGTLVETLARLKLPELLAFASQLDLVAGKGAAGPQLMAGIAGGLAREHRLRVMRAAEELESDLVLPATLFFFLPFVVAIMIPLLVPLLEAF